jgi:hypothetical protein
MRRRGSAQGATISLIVWPIMFIVYLVCLLFFIDESSRSTMRNSPPKETTRFRTVVYDNHWLIVPFSHGGAMHHPDCPTCKPATLEAP